MRWLFADPANPEEVAAVREKLAAIDRWWQEFQANQSKLANYVKRTTRFDLAAFMEEALLAIDPRLMYEFGAALHEDGNRLVITPQSSRWLRPLVRTLLERAPQAAGWEFYAYRPPEAVPAAIETLKARTDVDVSEALIAARLAPGRKVELTYHFPAQEFDEEAGLQAAFNTTEALLGEQVLDTWIGNIEVVSSPPEGAVPIAEAQIVVATLIRGLVDRIGRDRINDLASTAEMQSVVLDSPAEAEDYPRRDDVVSASMSDMELLEAVSSGLSFTSACHSKIGESFCYLKLDVTAQPDTASESWLAKLADGLNAALLAVGAGCCVGLARGLKYGYIDLAATDLKQTVAVARGLLAEHRAPLRSWLLFHDDDFAAEWIGIYRETPPPPLALDAEE